MGKTRRGIDTRATSDSDDSENDDTRGDCSETRATDVTDLTESCYSSDDEEEYDDDDEEEDDDDEEDEDDEDDTTVLSETMKKKKKAKTKAAAKKRANKSNNGKQRKETEDERRQRERKELVRNVVQDGCSVLGTVLETTLHCATVSFEVLLVCTDVTCAQIDRSRARGDCDIGLSDLREKIRGLGRAEEEEEEETAAVPPAAVEEDELLSSTVVVTATGRQQETDGGVVHDQPSSSSFAAATSPTNPAHYHQHHHHHRRRPHRTSRTPSAPSVVDPSSLRSKEVETPRFLLSEVDELFGKRTIDERNDVAVGREDDDDDDNRQRSGTTNDEYLDRLNEIHGIVPPPVAVAPSLSERYQQYRERSSSTDRPSTPHLTSGNASIRSVKNLKFPSSASTTTSDVAKSGSNTANNKTSSSPIRRLKKWGKRIASE